MKAALLLNASFEPLKVISWQKAVTLFLAGKAEIVEEYEHNIRSVSFVIKAPAVVRLLRYVKMGQRKPPLTRINVLARDQFMCQYCGVELTTKEATMDHVIPRSQRGTTTWTNVVTCCSSCNRKKGGRTPKEARMALLSTPVQPDWLPVLRIKLNDNVPRSWLTFLRSIAGTGEIT